MEDKKIIELYWQRSEQAITETDIKYGKLCKQLAKNILYNISDAEEVVNETYLGVWNAIPPERPKYLKTFICRITKNIAMAKARYYNAEKIVLRKRMRKRRYRDILAIIFVPLMNKREISS